MLADELPDFVAGLVRLAATGRSLGVHLVLATQRPAGIVTGDMRTNIALRICLRVRDRADSDDVIESPDAAALLESQPGRAYLRRDGRLLSLQAAHVGGPSEVSSGATVSVRTIQPTSDASAEAATDTDTHTATEAPSDSGLTRQHDVPTELSAFVDVARQVAEQLGVVTPPAPWLPPLPERLAVDALPAADGRPVTAVPFGLTDRPASQRQETATWDPMRDGHLGVVGGARSGRTTLARTLVAGLAARWSPTALHVHVVEGHAGCVERPQPPAARRVRREHRRAGARAPGPRAPA